MRRRIIAGNWKMNKTFKDAESLLYDISDLLAEKNQQGVEVIVCPPSVYLELAVDIAYEEQFHVGAQNVNQNEFGAFTGEISAPMLKSIEVDFCIVGHSERRKFFNEKDDLLAQKINVLLKHDLTPIFCCGELLEERKNGKHFNVVQEQLNKALFHLNRECMSRLILAYEPVWAIGTGENATPEQAQEMHAFIRHLVEKKYDKNLAEDMSILYGGSCNSKNAAGIFSKSDVDGGLIGGASLDADEFVKIVCSFTS
jgi:triosephosphate isomerase